MDLKIYYDKIREVEAMITDEFPVVESKETGDGGQSGLLNEVNRRVAARMVVEGTAHLATEEQAIEFRLQLAEAQQKAVEDAASVKLQVAVVSSEELKRLRGGGKPQKD